MRKAAGAIPKHSKKTERVGRGPHRKIAPSGGTKKTRKTLHGPRHRLTNEAL